MAGFGGDARLALISGVAEGINKRRETQRNAERQAILNRLAEVQIQQMEDNMRIREENRVAEQAAAEAEAAKAAQEQEAEMARLTAAANVLRRRNPELSEQEAMELVQELSPTGMTQLAFGEEEGQAPQARPMTGLEAERMRALKTANDLAEEVQRLRNHPVGLRLRQALMNPRYEKEMNGVKEMARNAGFSDVAIDTALLEMQPKDAKGNVKMTKSQQAQLELEAEAEVQDLIQKAGSPEAALAFLHSEGPDEGDDDYFAAMVSALERILKGEGGGVEDAFSGEAQTESMRNQARSRG